MKRNLVVAALVGVAGSAMAQSSSLTIYGIVDEAISHGSGSVSSKTYMGAARNASRLGFRGFENLGGGMGAGFNLEGQVNVDDGSGGTTSTNNQASGNTGGGGFTFGRRSTVSLFAPWGEIRLGRDFTSQYRNRVEIDPFYNIGVASIQPFAASQGGPVSTRASNIIAYYLPEKILGGVYGQAQYYLGEQPSNTAAKDDGTGKNFRLGYLFANTLNVSVSAAHTHYTATATAGSINTQNLGVQYKAGPFHLMSGLYRDTIFSTVGPLEYKGWSIGGIWTMGANALKGAVSEYGLTSGTKPHTTKLSLGVEHFLSKRTTLYVNYGRLHNANGAANALGGSITAPNESSWGTDVGVNHYF